MSKILQTKKQDLLNGIDKALAQYQVAALTQKDDRLLYDFIKTSQAIVWACQQTVLSPKKFFFPQDEVLLEYTPDGKITPKTESKPLVLLGIHPCDINAIKILGEAFADSHGDPNYLSRREKAIIIGLDCKAICDEHAFCYKVNSHNAPTGFDIMMHHVDDHFILDVATSKGEEFVKKYIATTEGGAAELEKYRQERNSAFAKEKPFKDLEKLPEIFEKNKHHQVWEEEGKRCLSCGSCIMVCPTCYCFDVADDWALNLKKGERVRRWDACMLNPFAEVAGGENFRHSAVNRLHHRISRKFNYLMRKHKQSVCVGCGRCVRACLAEISPKTIVEKIT